MAANAGTPVIGRRKHHRRKVMSEINVTPMVDVMLVLLIIFMVSAPLPVAPLGYAHTAHCHRLTPYARSSICRDRMAENSSAKPSRRWACLFTSDANLL